MAASGRLVGGGRGKCYEYSKAPNKTKAAPGYGGRLPKSPSRRRARRRRRTVSNSARRGGVGGGLDDRRSAEGKEDTTATTRSRNMSTTRAPLPARRRGGAPRGRARRWCIGAPTSALKRPMTTATTRSARGEEAPRGSGAPSRTRPSVKLRWATRTKPPSHG